MTNSVKTSELCHLSIAEASNLIEGRRLSPVDLTEAHLQRVEQLDGRLHSFLCVTAERARENARLAEKEIVSGRYRGPLHGIPFGLKDVFATAGIPTTGNSPAFKNQVPAADATVTRILEGAGGILIGKQATHELTYGGVSLDLPWPPPSNPWNLAHDTGGSSSGGGAAVASGLCMMAMGTDTGGSVRNPAANCGVVGLKPTYGRVSRSGVMMNSYSFDHCGPLTRNVQDCAIVLEIIARHDPLDPASAPVGTERYTARLGEGVKGLKVGLIEHFFDCDLPASDEIRSAMREATNVLQELGAHVETVVLDPVETYALCKATIQLPEIYAEFRQLLEEKPEAFGAKFRARIMAAKQISAIDYTTAQRERRQLTAKMLEVLQPFDVFITSGPYAPPPLLTEVAANWQFNKPEITVPFSLTGVPAISICNGFTRSGFPLSMQVVARPFDEATIFRVAHAYELHTPWHKRRPPL